jgi:tryptophan synthase alpha chain
MNPVISPRLAEMFAHAKSEGRPAFLPYFPIGYPSLDESIALIAAMADEGVDGFEIGMPFSDPLADGPVIQSATTIALDNGVNVQACLDAVRELRARGIAVPMMLMGYYNPILAYGVEAFLDSARDVVADGVIVPDLLPEEGQAFSQACALRGLAHVYFLAPTSSEERMRLVAQAATGFVYVVSVTGVTGARTVLPATLERILAQVAAQVKLPVVLGFGISQPEQVRALPDTVQGFIVGSAIVRAAEAGEASVRELVRRLRPR